MEIEWIGEVVEKIHDVCAIRLGYKSNLPIFILCKTILHFL